MRRGVVVAVGLSLGLASAPARAGDDDLAGAAIGIGVTGGVFALIGGAALIARKAIDDDVTKRSEALAAQGFAAPCASDPDACAVIAKKLKSVDDAELTAIGFLSGAGACALGVVAAGVKYATEGGTAAAPGPRVAALPARIEVKPAAGPEGGSVTVAVHF
ncbi:MAG: hypothetical protein IT373_18250 [Polyangiaceae bacterium]|nr:hypothetical protein [Polyangiaceae bacterium]